MLEYLTKESMARVAKQAAITLDINIGDTLLFGRFKNSPKVVKEIGTDENGQPTVNGLKLLACRIEKSMKPAKTASARLADIIKNIVIENAKGSRKEFGLEGYPLSGVTYPVDYGYHPDYMGQDEAELDFFVGSGNRHGQFDVWRPDVNGELETKFFVNTTPEERAAILNEFKPVLRGSKKLRPSSTIASIMGFSPEKTES